MKIKEYLLADFLESVQEALMDGYEFDMSTLLSYRGRYEVTMVKTGQSEPKNIDVTQEIVTEDKDPITVVAQLKSKKAVVEYAKKELGLDLNEKDGFINLKNDVIAVLEAKEDESNS